MANKKITELTELVSAASDDVLAIVDVSGTAETKKITVANLTSTPGILTQSLTTVSNAAVLTMKYDNTPITLVAAIAGKIIVPVSVTFVNVYGSPNETSSDDMRVGWDAATSGSSDYFIGIRDYMNGLASGTHTLLAAPFANGFAYIYNDSAVNQPLQAWCNDVFNGGWSTTIYTTYYTITV